MACSKTLLTDFYCFTINLMDARVRPFFYLLFYLLFYLF